MCGIVGITRKRGGVISEIKKSLKKLEYRGYDSSGIAIVNGNSIFVIKGVGTIDEVLSNAELEDGNTGIGHTRWATHGGVTDENAHPHISCDGKVALVHNGTLDDFHYLRGKLIERGHKFRSETDTEVVAHLIEEKIKSGADRFKAFYESIAPLSGSYAIAAIFAGSDEIFLARNKSPLVIGLGDGENYCASDITALLHLTNKFIFLDDGEVAVISPDEVKIWKLVGQSVVPVNKEVKEVSWSPSLIDKGSYPHFMLKEIYEQPHVLKQIAENMEYYIKFSQILAESIETGRKIAFVAAGTSYHASLVGKYLLSKKLKVQSDSVVASEFSEWGNFIDVGDLVIPISQSGETADVLEAVRRAKDLGAKVISIVNVPGSTLTRLSDETVYMMAGPEIGVAATKTYLAELAVIYSVITLAESYLEGKTPDTAGVREIIKEMSKVVEKNLPFMDEMSVKLSEIISKKHDVYYLGRGINYPTSLEGALKLKEISYIHAEGYPAGEYKHGPLALIEDGVPAVVLMPIDPELRSKIMYNVMEVKSRGATTIVVSPGDVDLDDVIHIEVRWDAPSEELSPLVYAVPLQLLAYRTAVKLGRNPDKPRNLAKSVTVE